MAAVSPAGPDPMISSFVRLASRSAPSSGPPGRLDRGRGTVAGGASKAIGGPKEIGPASPLPFVVSPPPKSIVRPANGSFFFSDSSLIASHRSTERIPPGGIGQGSAGRPGKPRDVLPRRPWQTIAHAEALCDAP